MSTPLQWEWPGARWWLCDLHIHTPASQDVRERGGSNEEATPSDVVNGAVGSGLDVIAITDHDSGEWIDRVKEATAGALLTVIPGIEITTHERLHLLVLGDIGRTTADAHHLLSRLGIDPSEYGMKAARASTGFPLETIIAEASDAGWLCVAAHVDAPATSTNPSRGALWTTWAESDRGRMKTVLDDPKLVAAEVVGDEAEVHAELRGAGRPGRHRLEPGLALVRFSDAHDLEAIGTRSTWIKMTRPDREGLMLAFSDGDRSVRFHENGLEPNTPPKRVIERLEIKDLKYAGRGQPLVIQFNPWLNVIVGGRGAGKSTIVNALRIALGRADEALSEDFARFNQIGGRESDGALTDTTELTSDYRRDGHRLRASWTNASAARLMEPQGETWALVDGLVTQRTPARVIGQGELARLAEDARQLLALVDDTPEVDRRRWQEAWDAEEARFLSLRARSREARAAIPDRSALLGERTDLERAIEMLERDEHRNTLVAYQQLQRQIVAIDQWRSSIDAVASRLRSAIEQARIDDPPLPDFEGDGYAADVRSSLITHHRELQTLIEQISRQVEGLSSAIEHDLPSTWDAHRTTTEEAYQALTDEIAASGANPSQYADLISRRQEVESRLAGISEQEATAQGLESEAEGSLHRLEQLRDELSDRRQKFIDTIGAPEGIVRFNLTPAGERDANAGELRTLLLGASDSDGMKQDIDTCTSLIGDAQDGLMGARAVKEQIRKAAAGADDSFGGWFRRRLTNAEPEVFDRLDAWFPADRLEAEYQNPDGDWQPISQGSAGQRNAAILAFLLSYGQDPLVLDQPENDLDNALISDLVVRLLRDARARRQLIVVTHNPNIVVNADADLVASLHFTGGRVTIRELGGLQEQAVRDEVCRVVEGGRTAFESRYARIGERHL